MAKSNKNSKKSAQTTVRRGLALSLRIQGGSYPKIAQTMVQARSSQQQYADVIPEGYDQSRAYKDVAAELDRLNKENTEQAEQLRQMMFLQLMELWSVYYPKALKSDLFSANFCLSLQNQIIRLFGLDKTQPGPTLNVNMGGVSLEEWRAKVRRQLALADEAIEVFTSEEDNSDRALPVPA